MAEKPDFDKIFANKATSVHEWDSDNYNTGWGFLGETPPPYELFDSLQRENDTKAKYLYERTEEVNTDLNDKYDELKTGLGGANTALQQHNVDENAHANLFQRALVTETNVAANTADWNTLTESRTYKISGATFAADKHQPVGAIGTGELVVLKNGDDTIVQVYYANSTEFDKAGAYHRVNVGGTWTDWVYNITNKGGTVTGDFNINGKLTVDSIEVSDSLTIGGAEPLKQDAIDKLQAQIISPTQTIYIDQKTGNDDNDGTTQSKAVRTLDKAVSLVKPYTDTVKFMLLTYIEAENQMYNTFNISNPIDNEKLNIDNMLFIGTWENYRTNQIVAKIIIPYGSTPTGLYDYSVSPAKEYRSWGRVLLINPNKVTFQSVVPIFPENVSTDTSKNVNTVIHNLKKSFSFIDNNNVTLELKSNCHFFNLRGMIAIDTIDFGVSNTSENGGNNGIITGTSLLFHNSDATNIYKYDPLTVTENNTPISGGGGTVSIITKYIRTHTQFTGNVLGSTKGLSSSVKAIYTQGFD